MIKQYTSTHGTIHPACKQDCSRLHAHTKSNHPDSLFYYRLITDLDRWLKSKQILYYRNCLDDSV